jgi:hypothetical protein
MREVGRLGQVEIRRLARHELRHDRREREPVPMNSTEPS